MTGHVRRRGARSWEIKFDLGTDPATGRRKTHYSTLKGTKKEAEAELTRLKAGADRGEYVDPSRLTVAEFLDKFEAWISDQVAGKTSERYKELVDLHVRPRLGALKLQRLRTVAIDDLYAQLRKPKAEGGAGLAARTVGHVHRLLHRALDQAVRWSLITLNPAAKAEPPRVEHVEIAIASPADAKALLDGLRAEELYIVAVIGLATGLRRGEMVALRWSDLDLEAGAIQVEQSLEQTKEGTKRKQPKTKRSRRHVSIPPSVVAELRRHRARQAERRLMLGLGKIPNDGSVVAKWDGSLYPPDTLTTNWTNTLRRLKLPKVTIQGLRHTHVSQLIAAGVDVVTVSRRIGHANPNVTLGTYAHLFGNSDERAAAAVERALSAMLTDAERA